jgi:hypothetical protein
MLCSCKCVHIHFVFLLALSCILALPLPSFNCSLKIIITFYLISVLRSLSASTLEAFQFPSLLSLLSDFWLFCSCTSFWQAKQATDSHTPPTLNRCLCKPGLCYFFFIPNRGDILSVWEHVDYKAYGSKIRGLKLFSFSPPFESWLCLI